jgi:uncharacterized protein YjiS (DUF1127 family)
MHDMIPALPTVAHRTARREARAADRPHGGRAGGCVKTLVRACGRLAGVMRGPRPERNELSQLNDHLLRDIGLTRDDALDPFERAWRHTREHD